MVYYSDDKITVRDMTDSDPEAFAEGERAQGWEADESKLRNRLKEKGRGQGGLPCRRFLRRTGGVCKRLSEI